MCVEGEGAFIREGMFSRSNMVSGLIKSDFWGRASEKLPLARPRTSVFSRPLQS